MDEIKLVKIPPCMECIKCKKKHNFMFFFNNDYYCSKCINYTKNNLKEYKFYF
jgi:hypothetical protein